MLVYLPPPTAPPLPPGPGLSTPGLSGLVALPALLPPAGVEGSAQGTSLLSVGSSTSGWQMRLLPFAALWGQSPGREQGS